MPPAQQSPFIFSKADSIVYVSDFELDAQSFQADEGRTKIVQRPGIIEGPRQQQKDPAVQAKKMVDLMATDIVNDLKKAGYKAQRLSAQIRGPLQALGYTGFSPNWTRATAFTARSLALAPAKPKWTST